ncbi:L,D-transpeptidase [Methylobacterium sp. J-068]|uniref:L,D-transpeptidase n=1 Tax=Methylobacterium sp. J-068 TaxID=2836649 RepID=UPI001FB9D624|nr:L,D-transpeptidase [Methylobacterium sp. J-068]MCJ2035466.1 L,D-transpeptidase [Methylobacterium sp. J-068]
MRAPATLLLLGALLPLGACNTRTTGLANAPAPVQVAAATPAPLTGEARDKAWMKLAPDAPVDPKIARTIIDYPTREAPGTVIVVTKERRLYYVLPDGKAVRYPVAVGHAGMAWAGTAEVDRKGEWPDWNPPPEMLARRPDLPKRLEGGPTSPIGARALYLAEGKKDTLFRIHGTNEPEKIGQAVSSGCIRMLNADVMDLYDRVPIGAKVVVR